MDFNSPAKFISLDDRRNEFRQTVVRLTEGEVAGQSTNVISPNPGVPGRKGVSVDGRLCGRWDEDQSGCQCAQDGVGKEGDAWQSAVAGAA